MVYSIFCLQPTESEKLAQDLQKVEQLESKITSELDQLKERIRTMAEEIEIYSDIEKLKNDAEVRKQVCCLSYVSNSSN